MASTANGKSLSKHTRAATVDFAHGRDANRDANIKDTFEQPISRQRSATTTSRVANHQRFVLADPVAFSYLEDDPSTTVLERSRLLQGYQCYLVEQWACSRTHPTFIITAYTGDSSHMIRVGILSVPANEESWSPRLKVYFKSLLQYHARRKDTPVGALMVTNLSGFPSSLNVLAVPDGDVKKHREDFFVNEDLKRLGCTGRVGISLAQPSVAAQGKFYQLYRTSEKIDLYKSVLELVKLCQAALMLFDCLDPEYADGLLCDLTEKAVHDWWDEIGTNLYGIEPVDGILGPSTVAALLGTLMGARNRLHAFGAPVAKDVFDIDATKRAINYFQKSQRIHRSRRLDPNTLKRLHKATAKQANTEGWTVPRAVKSTVAELGGKGGEMVLDMVGRDKASLAEIETIDIERFAQLVKGGRSKWLWHGKAHKRTTRDLFAEHPGQLTVQDDSYNGSFDDIPAGRTSSDLPIKQDVGQRDLAHEPGDPRKTVFKRATGRIKGAVGIKVHHSSRSKDGDMTGPLSNDKSVETLGTPHSEPTSPTSEGKPENFFDESKRDSKQSGSSKDKHNHLLIPKPTFARNVTETPIESGTDFGNFNMNNTEAETANTTELDEPFELSTRASAVIETEQSVADGVADELDLDSRIPPDERPGQSIGPLLRQTHSYSQYETETIEKHRPDRWPRNLSFSAADDLVLPTNNPWEDEEDADTAEEDPATDGTDGSDYAPDFKREPLRPVRSINPKDALQRELQLASTARNLRSQLARLGATTGTWLLSQTHAVANLSSLASDDAEQLASIHGPRLTEHRALADGSREIVREERARLAESVKDVETLGQRLEYEIEGLRGKVEDVESAVGEFERQVVYTEERVAELIRDGQGRGRGWWPWMAGWVFGTQRVPVRELKFERQLEERMGGERGQERGKSEQGLHDGGHETGLNNDEEEEERLDTT